MDECLASLIDCFGGLFHDESASQMKATHSVFFVMAIMKLMLIDVYCLLRWVIGVTAVLCVGEAWSSPLAQLMFSESQNGWIILEMSTERS